MKTFDAIVLIYNPKSTNDAKSKAEDFKFSLKKIGYTAKLSPTDHRGHAQEIAHSIVAKYVRPLIISVSGDGGYNEVINGVMDAQHKHPTCKPVVAVIGAGNANDHKRLTRGETPLIKLIAKAKPKPLDLIKLSTKGVHRYAHSYIGLGITPEVGIELNKHELSFFKELGIVIRTFRNFKPFEVMIDGEKKKLGSLVFANVNGMAKVLKLSRHETLNDGKFDIVRLPYHGTGRLLLDMSLMAIRAKRAPTAQRYKFHSISRLPVQLDGEIEYIAAHSEVLVESVKDAVDSLC